MRQISLDRAMDEVESDSFFARLSLITDSDVLLYFLRNSDVVQELGREATIEDSTYQAIFERLKALVNTDSSHNKLHPYDHSIACYLYVLFDSGRTKIEPVLEFILTHKLPNLFWTYLVYNFVVNSMPVVETAYCDAGQVLTPRQYPPIKVEWETK
jgi:hypothetical protein